MPIQFVQAVDYSPNINSPGNVFYGFKMRLARTPIILRHIEGNSIKVGYNGSQVLVDSNIPQSEITLKSVYCENIRRWSQYIESKVTEYIDIKEHEYNFDEWIQGTNYSGRRKLQLQKAFGPPENYYKVKTFIKKEPYPEIKPARTINSRDDKFKAIVGPFMHNIEKDVFSSKFTVKGKDYKQQTSMIVSRLSKFKRFVCTDYSRWETSISPEIISMIELPMFEKYKSPFNWDFHGWLREHLLSNNLKCQGKFSAKLEGVRMSGDMHTSLMNTYINLMLTSYICDKADIQWDGFFEGDDGMIGVETSLSDEILRKHFSEVSFMLGFELKIDIYHELKNAIFLSKHYISHDVAVRSPAKAITHAQWSFSLHIMPPLDIVRARGYSLFLENANAPILPHLGLSFLRFASSGKLSYPDNWYKTFFNLPDSIDVTTLPTEINVSNQARQLFADVYKIPIGLQLTIEQLLNEDDFENVTPLMNSIVKLSNPDWLTNFFNCSTDRFDRFVFTTDNH